MQSGMMHYSQPWSEDYNVPRPNLEKQGMPFLPPPSGDGNDRLMPQTSVPAFRTPEPGYQTQQNNYKFIEDKSASWAANYQPQYVNAQNIPLSTTTVASVDCNEYSTNINIDPAGMVYNNLNHVQAGRVRNSNDGVVRFLESSGFQVDQHQAVAPMNGAKGETYLCLDDNDLVQNPTLNNAINNPSMLDILSEYDNQTDETGFGQVEVKCSSATSSPVKSAPAKSSPPKHLYKKEGMNLKTYDTTPVLYIDADNTENVTVPPKAQVYEVRKPRKKSAFCKTRQLAEQLQHSCSCIAQAAREEVPVVQVFMRDGQMYRLPETNIIRMANIDYYSFIKDNNCYLSLALFFREMGFGLSKKFEKEIMRSLGEVELQEMGENELELMRQKCNLSSQTKLKDLINIADIRKLSKSLLKQEHDNETVRQLALGVYYQKILSSCAHKCSICGLLCRPAAERGEYVPMEIVYPECEPIKTTVIDDNVQNTIIVDEPEMCFVPYTLGKLNLHQVSLTAFKHGDKTFLSMKDIITSKFITLKLLQLKMSNMQFQPITAPNELEEIFKQNNMSVVNTLWVEVMELRCCIAGNTKSLNKQKLGNILFSGQYQFIPEYTVCCQSPESTKKNIVINSLLEIDKSESLRTNVAEEFPFLIIGRTTTNGRPAYKANKKKDIPHLPLKHPRKALTNVIPCSPDTTTDNDIFRQAISNKADSSTAHNELSVACGTLEKMNGPDGLSTQVIPDTQVPQVPGHIDTESTRLDTSDKENDDREANNKEFDTSLVIDVFVTDHEESVVTEVDPADRTVSSSLTNINREEVGMNGDKAIITGNNDEELIDKDKQYDLTNQNKENDLLIDNIEHINHTNEREEDNCENDVEMEIVTDTSKTDCEETDGNTVERKEVERLKLKPGRYIVRDRELFQWLVQNNKVWVNTRNEEVLDTQQLVDNTSHKEQQDKQQYIEAEKNDISEEKQTEDGVKYALDIEKGNQCIVETKNETKEKQTVIRSESKNDAETYDRNIIKHTLEETDKSSTVVLSPGKYIVSEKEKFAQMLQESRVRLTDGTVCQSKNSFTPCDNDNRENRAEISVVTGETGDKQSSGVVGNKDLSAYEIHRHLDPYCTQHSEYQTSEQSNNKSCSNGSVQNSMTRMMDKDKSLEEETTASAIENKNGKRNRKNDKESSYREDDTLNKSNEISACLTQKCLDDNHHDKDTVPPTEPTQSDNSLHVISNISYTCNGDFESSESEAVVSTVNNEKSTEIKVEVGVKSEVDSSDSLFLSPQNRSSRTAVTHNSSGMFQSMSQSPPLYTVRSRLSNQSDFELPITSTPIVSRRESLESQGMASRVNRWYTKIAPLNNSNSPDVSLQMLATIATADADSSSCDSDLCDPETAKAHTLEIFGSAHKSRDIFDVTRLTEEKQKMLMLEKKVLESHIKKYLVFQISKDFPPKFTVQKFKAGAERVFPVLFFPDPNHPKVVKRRKKFMVAAAQYLENLYLRHRREKNTSNNSTESNAEEDRNRNSSDGKTLGIENDENNSGIIQVASGKNSKITKTVLKTSDTSGHILDTIPINRSTDQKSGRPKQQILDSRRNKSVEKRKQLQSSSHQKNPTVKSDMFKQINAIQNKKVSNTNKDSVKLSEQSSVDLKQLPKTNKLIKLTVETDVSKQTQKGQKKKVIDSINKSDKVLGHSSNKQKSQTAKTIISNQTQEELKKKVLGQCLNKQLLPTAKTDLSKQTKKEQKKIVIDPEIKSNKVLGQTSSALKQLPMPNKQKRPTTKTNISEKILDKQKRLVSDPKMENAKSLEQSSKDVRNMKEIPVEGQLSTYVKAFSNVKTDRASFDLNTTGHSKEHEWIENQENKTDKIENVHDYTHDSEVKELNVRASKRLKRPMKSAQRKIDNSSSSTNRHSKLSKKCQDEKSAEGQSKSGCLKVSVGQGTSESISDNSVEECVLYSDYVVDLQETNLEKQNIESKGTKGNIKKKSGTRSITSDDQRLPPEKFDSGKQSENKSKDKTEHSLPLEKLYIKKVPENQSLDFTYHFISKKGRQIKRKRKYDPSENVNIVSLSMKSREPAREKAGADTLLSITETNTPSQSYENRESAPAYAGADSQFSKTGTNNGSEATHSSEDKLKDSVLSNQNDEKKKVGKDLLLTDIDTIADGIVDSSGSIDIQRGKENDCKSSTGRRKNIQTRRDVSVDITERKQNVLNDENSVQKTNKLENGLDFIKPTQSQDIQSGISPDRTTQDLKSFKNLFDKSKTCEGCNTVLKLIDIHKYAFEYSNDSKDKITGYSVPYVHLKKLEFLDEAVSTFTQTGDLSKNSVSLTQNRPTSPEIEELCKIQSKRKRLDAHECVIGSKKKRLHVNNVKQDE